MITKRKNFFLIVLGVVGLLYLFYWLFLRAYFPSPSDPDRFWNKPWNFQDFRYSFCKYTVPENFQIAQYTHGKKDEREMVVLRNQAGNSVIVAIKFDELPSIEISQVSISEKPVLMTMDRDESQILEHLKIIYLWPMFKTDKWQEFGKDLTLKGIQVKSKEFLRTDEYDGLYVRGRFQRIGLFKEPVSFFKKLVVPVLDFEAPTEGAIAVINNKQTNQTIFVIMTTAQKVIFDEKVFKDFLKSISFKNTYRPPYPDTNYVQVSSGTGPFRTTSEFVDGQKLNKSKRIDSNP